MRDLTLSEIGTVSGGETRMDPVIVIGHRLTANDHKVIRDKLSEPFVPSIPIQYDSPNGEGDPNLIPYPNDPSPDDGVPGLLIEEVGEFDIRITVEVDGYFDISEGYGYEAGKGDIKAFANQGLGIIEDTPENRAWLGRFVPTPGAGV